MPPFFSIIIPVYNVAPYLRECLDSVLTQTFSDWEAICVDDGSTDGSGAILDEYAAKDKRFRVIHQSNTGVGATRNKALDEARGEWLCFLDADDVWCEKFLSVFAKGIQGNPQDNCFRVGFIQFNDSMGLPDFGDASNCKFARIDISQTISMLDFVFFYFFCYVYKRELFNGVRFPRYIRGEDRCVLNKIQLERVDNIVATECKLYGYRQRPGSAMNTVPSPQVLRDDMDHRLEIMEMIDASGKKVDYAGHWWLEGYFTRDLSGIVRTRGADRREVMSDWRERLVRLRCCKGLSRYGRFVAWTCPLVRLRLWDYLVCFAIPRLSKCGSLIRRIIRKLASFVK